MSSPANKLNIPTVADGARPSTDAERKAMLNIVAKLDEGIRTHEYAAVLGLFHPKAVCELKPVGLRIGSLDTLREMFRRTVPKLSHAFVARTQTRGWSNQNGIVREWSYPVHLESGDRVPTTQLEIIEFADDLKSIKSYRVRMNNLYSKLFVWALGEDFMSLPGVARIPG